MATERRLRADARRNRAAILEAAEELLRARGVDVPVDDIAARAGVGVGTIYRHYPTKEALLSAIVAARLQPLVDAAHEACQAEDPGEAFFAFLGRMAEEFAGFKTLADAMLEAGFDLSAAKREASQQLLAAGGELLARAQQAGRVRPDVSIGDVTMLMAGLGRSECPTDDDAQRGRYVGLVCDALGGDPRHALSRSARPRQPLA